MSDEEKSESKTETPAPPQAADKKKWTIFAIVSLLSLVADQATKIWARASLPVTPLGGTAAATCQQRANISELIRDHKCQGSPVTVIKDYWEWRLSMNPGSAFGLFSGQTAARVFLSLVGIGAVFGMLWMLKKSRTDQRVLHWALAFVAGGAVGNLVDRMYFSVVTDMVLWRYKTHEWPVFNVADIVLVVGVGLMFIDIQKEGKRDKAIRDLKKQKREAAKKAGLVKDLVE